MTVVLFSPLRIDKPILWGYQLNTGWWNDTRSLVWVMVRAALARPKARGRIRPPEGDARWHTQVVRVAKLMCGLRGLL
jgi:hypothetical protein